ncbi:MAG: conjugal transfer protein TraL [Eubacteriales bacterium]|nr:conjugal transfer protein TraL [Eubacteriales bacterium]
MLLLLCIFAFAVYLILKTVKPSAVQTIISCTLIFLAFYFRYLVLDYETPDYTDFLAHWVDYFRLNGGFAALKHQIGNYNIPYLYFLALFSYSDISDLYLIKLLSILFDVLLAWGAMLITGRITGSKNRMLTCFIAVLFLPTVFLNGSLWGQCDSSYVALALLAVYCAMDDRPALSMVLAALSFGFKLQSVFILPVFVLFLFNGRLKIRHLVIFPLTYIALVLPAVLLGRPFLETLTLYFNQTGSIGDGLNYNSPSVFAMFQYSLPEKYNNAASKAGIIAAFAYMLTALVVCYVNRKKLTDRMIVTVALLFAIGIPFLLPHMHDRYFFCADVLSVIFAFIVLPLAAVPLLVQFASLLGYYAYLKMEFLLSMNRGSWALISALVITASYVIFSFVSFRHRKSPS